MKKRNKKHKEPNSAKVGKDKLTAQVKALERELVKPWKNSRWKKVFN